jgi:hypothetical protein
MPAPECNPMFSFRKVGGIWFLRLVRIQFSFCVVRRVSF